MIRFVQILKLAMETHEEGETNKQTKKTDSDSANEWLKKYHNLDRWGN